jgi:hypothetical protein
MILHGKKKLSSFRKAPNKKVKKVSINKIRQALSEKKTSATKPLTREKPKMQ